MRVPRLLRWLLWPATVAHELTHALMAVVLGCDVRAIELGDWPHVEYRAPDSGLAIPAAVNIAPAALGLCLGIVATLSGAEAALGDERPIAWGVAVLWWLRYTTPSLDDILPIAEAIQTARAA